MLKTIAKRYAKRAAARRRAIRRKAAMWKQRARRALTLMAVAGGMLGGSAGIAHAQIGGMGAAGGFGQGAMAPAGGLLNGAVTRLQNLEANGPGWLYYGFNAADRGLGYNGSYMTLGGFIPYAEDDLGGLWSADLRSHLSEYGGFFSNVGFVRKQFLGGTILGVGVYWDYDGDQNQYPLRGTPCGTGILGQFGHSYNQVGVSGEWLTDYGNIRSNGYIPVGTTAYTAGAPGSPFYQNFVMCQYGLDAALSGADLEVGAYVPGLSDWAGMVSVGGYALGNSRYNWYSGTNANKDVVPWFGGVYTRLDLTLVKNWDFSLQANNDSFFDWTGFARLTYRMGGSRRRNVPDQMEQPMMRNEHIVRAHQTPVVAYNPSTGTPWRVIHVNNAAATAGNGSAEAPFKTLAAGNDAATNPWDIVFVDRGTGTAVGYDKFTFNAPNQSLIGNGAAYFLPTECCGPINLATNNSGLRPLLSNPTGASVVIGGTNSKGDVIASAGGAVVSNFDITGSATGIYATGNLTGLPRNASQSPFGPQTLADYKAGASFVNNVTINGTGAGQTGIFLNGDPGVIPNATKLEGKINFTNTAVTDVTQFGMRVDGPSDAGFEANFNGSIQTSAAENIVLVKNMTGGTVNVAVGQAPAGSTVPNEVKATGGGGIRLLANDDQTKINIDNVSLTNTTGPAIQVQNDSSTTSIKAGSGTGISRAAAGPAIEIAGTGVAKPNPKFTYTGPITNARAAGSASPSYLLSVDRVGPTSEINIIAPTGKRLTDTGDGISIQNVDAGGQVKVIGATIASAGSTGIAVNNSSGKLLFEDISITAASTAGVSLLNNQPSLDATFKDLNISLSAAGVNGILASSAVANPYKISVLGPNNLISTAASALPAISIEAAPGGLGTPTVDMQFGSVVSGAAAGTNTAMVFGAAVTGNANVTGAFSVNGGTTKGTVAGDVTPGGVTVTVP